VPPRVVAALRHESRSDHSDLTPKTRSSRRRRRCAVLEQ